MRYCEMPGLGFENVSRFRVCLQIARSIENRYDSAFLVSSQGRRSRNDVWTTSQRRDGRTMASTSEVFASTCSTRSAAPGSTFDFECGALSESNWLPVASIAARLFEVEDGLHHLSALA